jgi:glycosyltransferase involved in cell wall biosynthesis
MKILMLARKTLYTGNGGDTVQVLKTAEYLRKRGHLVDVVLNGEHFKTEGYDIVHFFNVIRPADLLVHLPRIKVPIAVSTIYVNYLEVDKLSSGRFYNFLLGLFGKNGMEYTKTIGRWLLNNEPFPGWKYLLKGHANSVKYIAQKASVLLPNSESEANRFEKDYQISRPTTVVPNAIDTSIFKLNEAAKDRKGVICVGRIEYRKNQLNLIRAIAKTSYSLTLVGKPSPNQKDYYSKCLEEGKKLGSRFKIFNFVEEDQLVTLLKEHKVHALISWFETTGLVSLEAAAMGCEIIITDKGDTREYFGSHAHYCQPGNRESIVQAINQAHLHSKLKDFPQQISEKYTWSKTAVITESAYQTILGHEKS